MQASDYFRVPASRKDYYIHVRRWGQFTFTASGQIPQITFYMDSYGGNIAESQGKRNIIKLE